MSFWGKLFGTEEAVKEAVRSVSNGLDALVYTDEEKAADQAKAVTEARSMLVDWMKNTQGQNLARRFLALVITGVWLLQYLTAEVLDIAAVFVDDPEKITQASALIGSRASDMTGAMMLILGFYFAAPHMHKFADAAISRFSGKG